jgi:hypothetical protein
MGRAQKITLKALEVIAEKLRSLPELKPEQKEVGKQEAVAILKGEIVALRARGYSYEQIAEYLKGDGLDIGGAALKSYMTRANASDKASMKAPAKSRPSPKSRATVKADPVAKAKATSGAVSEAGKGSFQVKPDRGEI